MTGERFRRSSPAFLQRSPSPARFPSWHKLRLAAPSRGFCATFSHRSPSAAFSYSASSTHHVSLLSLPSARPAANGGTPFILHCFRRQLRGGWELWCIRQEGSCLGCCGVSDRKDRVWDAVKYPIMLVIIRLGYSVQKKYHEFYYRSLKCYFALRRRYPRPENYRNHMGTFHPG